MSEWMNIVIVIQLKRSLLMDVAHNDFKKQTLVNCYKDEHKFRE